MEKQVRLAAKGRKPRYKNKTQTQTLHHLILPQFTISQLFSFPKTLIILFDPNPKSMALTMTKGLLLLVIFIYAAVANLLFSYTKPTYTDHNHNFLLIIPFLVHFILRAFFLFLPVRQVERRTKGNPGDAVPVLTPDNGMTGNQDENLESYSENPSQWVLEHEEECTSEMRVSDDQCSDVRRIEIEKSEADRRFTEAADDVRSQNMKKFSRFGILESELKCPAPASSSCDCASIITKKDRQIEKMELEISILSEQRDLAQSKVDELSQMIENFLSIMTGNQDENLESYSENPSQGNHQGNHDDRRPDSGFMKFLLQGNHVDRRPDFGFYKSLLQGSHDDRREKTLWKERKMLSKPINKRKETLWKERKMLSKPINKRLIDIERSSPIRRLRSKYKRGTGSSSLSHSCGPRQWTYSMPQRAQGSLLWRPSFLPDTRHNLGWMNSNCRAILV